MPDGLSGRGAQGVNCDGEVFSGVVGKSGGAAARGDAPAERTERDRTRRQARRSSRRADRIAADKAAFGGEGPLICGGECRLVLSPSLPLLLSSLIKALGLASGFGLLPHRARTGPPDRRSVDAREKKKPRRARLK